MDRNATNLDKLLKSQTWRGQRALITHVWMTVTSVLSQTKSRILYVWQESHMDPQAVASNYKENMFSWGSSSLQRVVKSLGLKCRKCIWHYVPCTLFYFMCILLLLITRRSSHFNINHSESLKAILINMCTQVQCILLNLIYFTIHKEYWIITVWIQGIYNTDTISYSTFKILYFKQIFWSFSVHTTLYFLIYLCESIKKIWPINYKSGTQIPQQYDTF
jgi:hypothetical protein